MDLRFSAPRPRHPPPESLTDGDLAATIASLHRKLRSARRSLLLAHAAGASLTVVVLGAGFAVLSLGPAPFFERFLGQQHVTTTIDAAVWWIVILFLAILGGAVGDQALRGKLRVVRGWRHRVHDLSRRLAEAEDVHRTRVRG
ncbi:MAG: hypothetical protein ACHQQ3_12340 [Gemmatimonadales bacterium]